MTQDTSALTTSNRYSNGTRSFPLAASAVFNDPWQDGLSARRLHFLKVIQEEEYGLFVKPSLEVTP